MTKLGWILIAASVLLAISTSQAQERFKLIGADDSDELEQELNEAGAAGYRFAGSQGGKSTFLSSRLRNYWGLLLGAILNSPGEPHLLRIADWVPAVEDWRHAERWK